jgi:hypothetical protein
MDRSSSSGPPRPIAGIKIGVLALLLVVLTATIALKLEDIKRYAIKPETRVFQIDPTAAAEALKTDFKKHSIDPGLIMRGGPAKDGIPSLDDPQFAGLGDEIVPSGALGILVEHHGEQRFYPYNILVYHELVNDTIGDLHLLVSYCPLCGTGMVFDREIDGEPVEFGVSGMLYESNLLMYDRKTESLWSQTLQEAVAGELTGRKLELLPMQIMTIETVRKQYPEARMLSRETGFGRDYDLLPYGGYDTSDGLMFPVQRRDDRLHAKAMLHVVNLPDGESSLAIPLEDLTEGAQSRTIKGFEVTVKKTGKEIEVGIDGRAVPGYREMWFSWYTHHHKDGVMWDGIPPENQPND